VRFGVIGGFGHSFSIASFEIEILRLADVLVSFFSDSSRPKRPRRSRGKYNPIWDTGTSSVTVRSSWSNFDGNRSSFGINIFVRWQESHIATFQRITPFLRVHHGQLNLAIICADLL
jgi:hypothetical protein